MKRACFHCGAEIYRDTTRAAALRGIVRHQALCALKSPAEREYFLAHRRWPDAAELNQQQRADLRAWCKRAPHISAVADAVGLSFSTLAKALAGKPVGEVARRRIERALAKRRAS